MAIVSKRSIEENRGDFGTYDARLDNFGKKMGGRENICLAQSF